MNAAVENVKTNLLKLKSEGKITDKIRVFLAGYLDALFQEGIIDLDEVEYFKKTADLEKAEPFGVGELLNFGNFEEFKNSKLEF